jgi:hypothetical protein
MSIHDAFDIKNISYTMADWEKVWGSGRKFIHEGQTALPMKPFAIGACKFSVAPPDCFTVSGYIPQPWFASTGQRDCRRNQSKYQFATVRVMRAIH